MNAYFPTIALTTLASLIFSMSLFVGGCTETTAAVNEEDLTTLNYSVSGMHCEGCVSSVRNAIARIDGVASCDVSLADESATVKTTDPAVSQAVIAAVEALDFSIEPVGG